MIALALAICLIATLLMKEKVTRGATMAGDAAKVVGTLLAAAVIWSSILNLGKVRPRSLGSFRTGELIPSIHPDHPFTIGVTYIQRSWWGTRVEGRWTARPDQFGEWTYLENGKGWRRVPVDFDEEANKSYAVDNHGPYDER